MTSAVAIDLMNVDAFVRGEHHAMFDWLREYDPVYWHPSDHPSGGFWALTRHADVSAAYLDNGIFQSSGGAMLGGSYRNEADTAAGRMLVSTDPPRHRLLRQQIHRAFAPDVTRRVAEQVTTLVEAAIKQALNDGGCDFATDIAPELPAGALMGMVGIGYQDAHHLIGLTRKMIGFRDPVYVDTMGDERLRLAAIQTEIFELFDTVLQERRARPGSDIVSILATAQINGRPLSDEEILYNCMNVAVGGNETTSHTACAGVVAFIEWPDAWSRLKRDEGLLDGAINEILRWSSTNAYVQRIVERDVEIGGKTLRRGDSVTLWNVSANRDPEQFPDPHSFVVDRSPNRHLAYGTGIHRCIGAALAHIELSILLRSLLRADMPFRLDGGVERVRSNFISGFSRLPLRIG